MKYNKITIPYRNYNEDGILINKPLYMVVDGATPLVSNQEYKNSSLASLFVDFSLKRIRELFNEDIEFLEILNIVSKEAYNYFKIDTDKPVELPSMGLACLIEDEKHYNLYILGDCAISYIRNNNVQRRFIDTRLTTLDNIILKEIKKGKTRQDMIQQLINHRNLIGKEYEVFIPSKNPTFKVKTKKIKKNNINKILLYTDGYYSIRDTFKIVKNHDEFVNLKIDEGLNLLLSEVTKDPNIKKYPRFKYIDDITVLELFPED